MDNDEAKRILTIISKQNFTDFNEGILTEYLEEGNEEMKEEVLDRIKYLFKIT